MLTLSRQSFQSSLHPNMQITKQEFKAMTGNHGNKSTDEQ